MDEKLNDYDALVARVHQLEYERDALHKDIEQLCMQNAGPGYLAVATRMHFERIAALEQEIENLKKKLATCIRENSNLQEELTEAYQIKSQLADLHSAEVLKNVEAEKQLKFFQGCVAAAFAERDRSIMEAEKAKEKEDSMSQKLTDLEKRVEELTTKFVEEKNVSAALRIDLEKREKQNENFKKVVNNFYEIRQQFVNGDEDTSWEDKCECLLHDSAEMWSFNDYSTSKYIAALETEVETLRKSVDNLQSKHKMGLEIENHLKKKINYLEKNKILSEEKLKAISELVHYHAQHREHIINLLDEGYSHLKSISRAVEDKINQFEVNREQKSISQADTMLNENECRDVHVNSDLATGPNTKLDVPAIPVISGDTSEALSQALQEKVAALLLLSQQEERYILESNVNAALQKKTEELQRNLLQVTNEKVKALMELAQLKQEYHQLQENISQDMKQESLPAEAGEKRLGQDRDGRLKNILKKTYLRRWVDAGGNEAETHQGVISYKRSNQNMDFARMKIENAAMKESLENMEHLTASIHRLRLSLLKVKDSVISKEVVTSDLEALENIIYEAKLVKTALGSSLPVSWSAEPVVKLSGEPADEDSSVEKIDSVSATGFEMVELLILASQILQDEIKTQRP